MGVSATLESERPASGATRGREGVASPASATTATTQEHLPRPLFGALLALVIAVHSALVWVRPTADPPVGYSRDLSLSVDGHWYSATARAWVEGRVAQVDRHYQKSWVTVPSAAIFGVFGIGLASERALSYLASVATLLLLSVLLARRFGAGAALVGACLLAFDSTWLVFVRSPIIYPWVSFWMLAALALAGSRGGRGWMVGLSLTMCVAVGLKSIALMVVPAICWEGWRWMGRTRFAGLRWPTFGMCALAALAAFGPWSVPAFWRQMANYVGGVDGGPFERLLTFESRSLLFSAIPILPIAALGSVLFVLGIGPSRKGPRAQERVLHTVLWTTLPCFAISAYTPLRYLLFSLPVVIYLFVGTLSSLSWAACRGNWRRSRLARFGSRAIIGGGAGSLLLVYWVSQVFTAASRSSIPATGVALGCTVLVLLATWAVGRSNAPRLALVCAAILSIPHGLRGVQMLTHLDHTLLRANAELAAVVPPEARVGGTFAHALTVESGIAAIQMSSLHYGAGKLRDRVRELGCTHVAFDEPVPNPLPEIFANEGVPLEFVVRVAVRGTPVVVYRLRDADVERSAFERGAQSLAANDLATATEHFREAARRSPQSASVWYRMGEVALRRGDGAAARAFFLRSLECDPTYFDAHFALGGLYASGGYTREAEFHRREARRALPDDPRL